ncbi:MAG: methionine--tRNA ligase subunit beta [archaeon]|nr:methionine--tRNA ligase subunit beta [archaeon]MCP8305864.1 methionine--tRNA ligase subunit beta [archaeon]
MKVGKIIDAQKVAGSKNLMKLMIDIGGAVKQSVAAIGDEYEPEQLKSKLVAVVTNLKPRKIFGLKSEVMILAALDGSNISILCPDKQVGTGSKVS